MLRLPIGVLVIALFGATLYSAEYQPPGEGEKKEKKGGPRFPPGDLFPPPAKEGLHLTGAQERELEALRKEAKEGLSKILTPEQMKQLEEYRPGRGGPGGGGGGPPEQGGTAVGPTKLKIDNRHENPPPPTPAGLKPIGGRWYVKEGKPNTYFFRDADKFVDLFANQIGDSNKDGIPDFQLRHDEKYLIMESQNLPNHPHANFPNSGNPNTIKAQHFVHKLPLVPKLAENITRVPMGPIGVAINGVVFFNPFEAGGMNAIAGYSEVWFDSCCGHPEQRGAYHYHKYPSCIKTPFPDDGEAHSPVIGFAFDGFPLYGPYAGRGVMAKDLTGDKALDACNGAFDPDRGYHYYATPGKFPYLIGGYAGVVEARGKGGNMGGGALVDNTTGTSRIDAGFTSLKPGTVERGKVHTMTLELNSEGRRRIPDGTPAHVIVGPFEGTKIARSGNVITFELAIPKDAKLAAWFDCHVEFAGGAVLKKNDVMRVCE